MINNILLVFHVLFSIGIIGLILLQQGKGADAGAAFGSGGSGTVFGARGSGTFLSRATAILAVLFFSTSLGLAYLANTAAPTGDEFSQKFKKEETKPAVELPVKENTAAPAGHPEPKPAAPADSNLPVNE